ncbi:hypothetical protein PIB30_034276 [Stylosanthes scabra]|uniref:Uncharacterized protein n=1 Tax=Stylosanthes scabra TaxID=79078 RepID=A0ABU6YD49_9FABA|nr:hypothetical protein [Stylosanthes scabra]
MNTTNPKYGWFSRNPRSHTLPNGRAGGINLVLRFVSTQLEWSRHKNGTFTFTLTFDGKASGVRWIRFKDLRKIHRLYPVGSNFTTEWRYVDCGIFFFIVNDPSGKQVKVDPDTESYVKDILPTSLLRKVELFFSFQIEVHS